MAMKSLQEFAGYVRQCKKELESRARRVLVCAGTGCLANGSEQVLNEFHRLSVDAVAVTKSGCHGFCEAGPLVKIEPDSILYVGVTAADVAEIVKTTLRDGKTVERLLYHHPVTGQMYRGEKDIPFYSSQSRVTLANCGAIDPDDIREYVARDGYMAMARAVADLSPDEIIEEMLASGLRGRGGGGFPTGRKWFFARNAQASQKYVVCNGDEGDPGAFMDRSVMEGDPHRVIEGLAIAGRAIGASVGYIYVRAEYPLAVARLRRALKQARNVGLLGDGLFGTDFSFDVIIKEGAGAFVCGEETALLASIEGRRGMPRPRPPFPANEGLWGKPTTINNVETLATVPAIMLRGAEWFQSIGREGNPGTKTFAITGQVANTGLIEVPMGKTLREVVFDIGGGLRCDKQFKAAQIGGPSGGCLSAEQLDIALDYDSLSKVGAMVGSGGLVVMDEGTCMVEVARFFMHFAQSESCGKCVPCREGTRRMLEILEKIVGGRASMDDLAMLEELAWVVKESSLCGLGKTAPNPVLTTLRYFRDEYLAHIVEHRCPAGVCTAFKSYKIDPALCRGCTKCRKTCPVGAISGDVKSPHVIDQSVCAKCGACKAACPFGAISLS
ncbi:MAG: NADH-quinone oxidoreductase subunit NuoF [Clostridia bacterium]|nr:NADH-quinone oxidoreductase subunit NuoF [Clostridia bacterium]